MAEPADSRESTSKVESDEMGGLPDGAGHRQEEVRIYQRGVELLDSIVRKGSSLRRELREQMVPENDENKVSLWLREEQQIEPPEDTESAVWEYGSYSVAQRKDLYLSFPPVMESALPPAKTEKVTPPFEKSHPTYMSRQEASPPSCSLTVPPVPKAIRPKKLMLTPKADSSLRGTETISSDTAAGEMFQEDTEVLERASPTSEEDEAFPAPLSPPVPSVEEVEKVILTRKIHQLIPKSESWPIEDIPPEGSVLRPSAPKEKVVPTDPEITTRTKLDEKADEDTQELQQMSRQRGILFLSQRSLQDQSHFQRFNKQHLLTCSSVVFSNKILLHEAAFVMFIHFLVLCH